MSDQNTRDIPGADHPRQMPDTPVTPNAPAAPDTAVSPDAQATPDAAVSPGAPAAPDAPVSPVAPATRGTPPTAADDAARPAGAEATGQAGGPVENDDLSISTDQELHLLVGPPGTGRALQEGQAVLQPLPADTSSADASSTGSSSADPGSTAPASAGSAATDTRNALIARLLRTLGVSDDEIARILARAATPSADAPLPPSTLHLWQLVSGATAPAGQPGPASSPSPRLPAGSKAVIICFSQHGNTEAAAWLIQKLIDAEVVPLKPVQLYPRDYKAASEQVKIENELGYLPKLNSLPIELADFSHIFLGFPTWDDRLPPPVRSWLGAQAEALAGKTLLPFTTHAGTGAGQSLAQVAECCPGARVMPGLALLGGSTQDNCALAIRGRRQASAERELADWLAQVCS